MLATLPFNRISMGIQTFNEKTLQLLKRRHTAPQAIAAVEHCRKAGFQNISIDLIYGLPGETAESWKYDLKQKAADLTSVELYVKPEENMVYYVMNKEITGSFYI